MVDQSDATSEQAVNILVVDDEPNLGEVMQRHITRMGYGCSVAKSAAEAARLLQTERFDIVTLDIMMPVTSGMQFLPEIVANYPATAVIMLTAVADTAIAVEALHSGATDYLIKPVDTSELRIRIERALEQRRLVMQNRAYQLELVTMVTEATEDLERKMRELSALNNLFRQHLNQVLATNDSYNRLQEAVADFSAQLTDLGEKAKVVNAFEIDLPGG